MRHYVSITRPLNGVMSIIAVWIGSIIAGAAYIPDTNIIIGAISVFLISGGGMAINDYFDANIDKVNKPKRPIPSGKIKKKTALIYSLALFVIGVALTYRLNIDAFYVAAAASLLLIVYAASLKKTMLLGNLVVSGLVGLTFLYGGVIVGNYTIVIPLAFLAFMSNMAREIYKTIDDAKGDAKHDVSSVAIKLGIFKARMIGNAFLIVAVIFSVVPYLLGILGMSYLIVVALADIVFLAAVAMPKAASKLVKLGMLLALLSFIVGVII